jgi:hypothetical protein
VNRDRPIGTPRVVAQGPAELFAGSAYDPSAAGGMVAWQRPSGDALRLRDGSDEGLPGTHPALGGGRIAWREGDAIVVADAATLARLERYEAPGAGALAVSAELLAWRTRDAAGTDRIWVVVTGAPPRVLLELPAPEELGRPALAGGRLLFHVAGPFGSRLMAIDVATGAQELLRAEPGALISNPATDGTLLLYVHATGRAQELRVGTFEPLEPADDEVLLVHASSGQRDREHDPGRRRHRHQGQRPQLPPRAAPGVVDTLWTTALTADAAYVTRLHVLQGAPRTADILRVPIGP